MQPNKQELEGTSTEPRVPALRLEAPESEIETDLHVLVGARSDCGVTRARNEDRFLVARMERALRVEATSVGSHEGARRLSGLHGTLLVIADGMGGHGAGDVASTLTIDTMATFAMSEMPWIGVDVPEAETILRRHFQDIMVRAQDRLHDAASRSKELPDRLGTTVTVAYIAWPHLLVAHVGDTRCYRLRHGSFEQLTTDHTVAEQLRRFGGNTAGFSHLLTNSIGGSTKPPYAEIRLHDLEDGDVLLLSTDGLHDVVDESAIASILESETDVEAAAQKLVERAQHDGGTDDITAVVARCSDRRNEASRSFSDIVRARAFPPNR